MKDMNDAIKDYYEFLSEEFSYLLKIKLFLLEVPGMIANGNINQLEFQTFLEKYEVETSRFVFEKKHHKEQIAKQLRIPVENVSLKLLVHLGHKKFEEKGRRVLKISNEITRHLLKISVYLKNFSKLQQDFKRLNNFLYQSDYSPRSMDNHHAYSLNRGRNFIGEA